MKSSSRADFQMRIMHWKRINRIREDGSDKEKLREKLHEKLHDKHMLPGLNELEHLVDGVKEYFHRKK